MTFLNAKQALLPDGWALDIAVEINADGRIENVTHGQSTDAEHTVPVTSAS